MASKRETIEQVGPYTLYEEIGRGGMASVHLGQAKSRSGFKRIVAIKRMHSDLARSPEFVAMFVEEASIASRIRHPNVVAAIDCVTTDDDAMLIMDYIPGVSLDEGMRRKFDNKETIPLPIATAILIGAALGLHAAHEAVDESGDSLGIVHRDVSPHNILVGIDGLARVLDFGIAKAAERAQHTRTGEVKGKLAYMAPEQLMQEKIGRQADVYSLGVVLWELVAGRRLFDGDTQGQMLMNIASGTIESPRTANPAVSPEVDAVVMKALARTPEARFQTALEFAMTLETLVPPAVQRVVGEWVASVAKDDIAGRAEIERRIEETSRALSEHPGDVITARFRLPQRLSENTTTTGVMVAKPTARSRAWLGAVALGSAAIAGMGVALWSRAPATRDAYATTSANGAATAALSAQASGPSRGVSDAAIAPDLVSDSAPVSAVVSASVPVASAPAPITPVAAGPHHGGWKPGKPAGAGANPAPASAQGNSYQGGSPQGGLPPGVEPGLPEEIGGRK
jgi:serine/threonine-protein kinase